MFGDERFDIGAEYLEVGESVEVFFFVLQLDVDEAVLFDDLLGGELVGRLLLAGLWSGCGSRFAGFFLFGFGDVIAVVKLLVRSTNKITFLKGGRMEIE